VDVGGVKMVSPPKEEMDWHEKHAKVRGIGISQNK
jgi:hypothetical protein